ncbi:hypothetical protein [Aquimarina muelleri]|uniref:Uncharacterized protein n=1 Tax=Aquimarina muelleri TaxID=279356 RepID=A0A918N2J6_9FLAO|nr:hypothetical protein [Aquimarina muelleri]MCX2763060.1 hypothetical protein [Aquimarina muelleri]GGX03089.1 hypothetical protein GCM10007384_01040 [Aquimarina muelleri]
MKEIKTIGIIGMGTIGNSISYILQQAGLNVIGFKHKNRGGQMFKELMENGKIEIVNDTGYDIFPRKDTLQIKVTSSLQEIVAKSDLIFNCCLFPQNSTIYEFSKLEKASLKKRKIPILAIPGTLGTNWLIGLESLNVGLMGCSPIFATKKDTHSLEGITTSLLDFKSKIPIGYDDLETRLFLLDFLNEHFKFKNNASTFIDGGSSIQTALSSPVSAINASAICDNAEKLIHSKKETIKEDIYMLSEEYSLLFQKIFDEQLTVANLLQIPKPQTIKEWLRNRKKNIQADNITEMLEEIYKEKYITISKQDRRLSETFYALSYFSFFAEALGHTVSTTNHLLYKLNDLQKSVNTDPFSENIILSLKQSATSYAEHIKVKRNSNKRKETQMV